MNLLLNPMFENDLTNISCIFSCLYILILSNLSTGFVVSRWLFPIKYPVLFVVFSQCPLKNLAIIAKSVSVLYFLHSCRGAVVFTHSLFILDLI